MCSPARAQARGRSHYSFLTSQERDVETGLDYFGARYLSSDQGRFVSVDPLMKSASIDDPQSFNRYAYVLNNPVNLDDPDGLCPKGKKCYHDIDWIWVRIDVRSRYGGLVACIVDLTRRLDCLMLLKDGMIVMQPNEPELLMRLKSSRASKLFKSFSD